MYKGIFYIYCIDTVTHDIVDLPEKYKTPYEAIEAIDNFVKLIPQDDRSKYKFRIKNY